MIIPAAELLNFGRNDRFCLAGLLQAVFDIYFRYLPQVINIVEIDIVDGVYLRVDIPWHGNIDEEEGAILSLPDYV